MIELPPRGEKIINSKLSLSNRYNNNNNNNNINLCSLVVQHYQRLKAYTHTGTIISSLIWLVNVSILLFYQFCFINLQ